MLNSSFLIRNSFADLSGLTAAQIGYFLRSFASELGNFFYDKNR